MYTLVHHQTLFLFEALPTEFAEELRFCVISFVLLELKD